MTIQPEILDALLKDCKDPSDPKALFGESGLLQQLTKGLVERAMNAEVTDHLGYGKHDPRGSNTGNSRNGTYEKTVQGTLGKTALDVPRDRNGTYEPKIVKKGQRRFEGFDDKIIAMYARGMTTRDIEAQLKELYGVDATAPLISTVTDAVADEVKQWRNRPLEAVYPIVYIDALFVKVRDSGHVINKAVYVVLGVSMSGKKELLGLWMDKSEGAKFWLHVLTELRNRGVQDIFICCADGLTGFPEALGSAFPQTQLQLCIVHLVRRSLSFVPWKEKKAVARDLRAIYTAPTAEDAEAKLLEFAEAWDDRYPSVSQIWQRHWTNITPLFSYPADIRKAVYTTNAIESINYSLRRVLKTRGSLPSDEAAFKLMYLALQNIAKKWTMPIREWAGALNQFDMMFEGRVPRN